MLWSISFDIRLLWKEYTALGDIFLTDVNVTVVQMLKTSDFEHSTISLCHDSPCSIPVSYGLYNPDMVNTARDMRNQPVIFFVLRLNEWAPAYIVVLDYTILLKSSNLIHDCEDEQTVFRYILIPGIGTASRRFFSRLWKVIAHKLGPWKTNTRGQLKPTPCVWHIERQGPLM